MHLIVIPLLVLLEHTKKKVRSSAMVTPVQLKNVVPIMIAHILQVVLIVKNAYHKR